MIVKYIGDSDPCCLVNGKMYECLGEESDCFRIIDEEGVDENEELQGYLYPKRFFGVIQH